MEEINDDCPKTDLVLVISANDIVNPGAETDGQPNLQHASHPSLECGHGWFSSVEWA